MSELDQPGDGPNVGEKSPPPPTTHPEAGVVELATPDWCWSRLRGTTQGLLSARRPRTVGLGVHYAVADRTILIPLAADPDLLPLLAGVEVTLGLEGRSEGGRRWVVRATGTAFLTVDQANETIEACRSAHPAQRAAVRRNNSLLLSVDRLRGYVTRDG